MTGTRGREGREESLSNLAHGIISLCAIEFSLASFILEFSILKILRDALFLRLWDEPCFQFLPWSFWSTSVARRLVLLMGTPERKLGGLEWMTRFSFHWESHNGLFMPLSVWLCVIEAGEHVCGRSGPGRWVECWAENECSPGSQSPEGEIAGGGGGWTSVPVCLRLICFWTAETFSSKTSTTWANRNRDGWASCVLNFPYLHKKFTVSWKLFPITLNPNSLNENKPNLENFLDSWNKQ